MRQSGFRGFTLVELLVVIGIIAILAAATGPALNTVLSGSHMNEAEQIVLGEFKTARQLALTKNRVVEVRIYRFGDPRMPGETESTPSSGRFRAIQLFEYDEGGSAIPVSKLRRLPSTVVMNSGATLSPLLESSRSKTWSSQDPKPSLSIGTNYDTRSFRFYPNGRTDLPNVPSESFLTLHKYQIPDTENSLPPNFVVVSVDPVNGAARTHR